MTTFLVEGENFTFLVLEEEIETAISRVVSLLQHELYKEDLIDVAFCREKLILRIKWSNDPEFSNQEDTYIIRPLNQPDIIIFTDYEQINSSNPKIKATHKVALNI